MSGLPLISVVVPTYERQDHLGKTIGSVASQSGIGEIFNIELVIVDDASPTPQSKFIERTDLPLRMVRHDMNQGAAAARNTGAHTATGDYIAFLDSDDIWYPDKLRCQLERAQELDPNGLWVIAGGFRLRQSLSNRWRDVIPYELHQLSDFVGGCRHCPGTMALMNRKTFQTVGDLDSRLRRLEDFEWFIRLGLAGGQLLVVPSILAEIAPSNAASKQAVFEAVNNMEASFRNRFESRKDYNTMCAYLRLEQAAVCHRRGNLFGTLTKLGESWFLHPRTNLHMHRLTSLNNHTSPGVIRREAAR